MKVCIQVMYTSTSNKDLGTECGSFRVVKLNPPSADGAICGGFLIGPTSKLLMSPRTSQNCLTDLKDHSTWCVPEISRIPEAQLKNRQKKKNLHKNLVSTIKCRVQDFQPESSNINIEIVFLRFVNCDYLNPCKKNANES